MSDALLLQPLTYQPAGDVCYGELVYDEAKQAYYLCVMTDSSRPKAFRKLFERTKDGWRPGSGTLLRFGVNYELRRVELSSGDLVFCP